ncbi:hypothetical protein C7B77_05950 [Chamaesiphon polymorphus CCALA 037]|uniref:Uncharacterized protein n=2 Tax=Chamaesiphon TaxID=217161 RepID=A0A2T1GK75_9CYAN|nr:hypothetical protein C7B77_05950 [Chamaesiphon polymorphus CCALA 037]
MIVNNMFVTKITLLTDRIAKISELLRWSKKFKSSMSAHDRHQLANDCSTVDLIEPVPPYDDPLY